MSKSHQNVDTDNHQTQKTSKASSYIKLKTTSTPNVIKLKNINTKSHQTQKSIKIENSNINVKKHQNQKYQHQCQKHIKMSTPIIVSNSKHQHQKSSN